MPPLRPWPGASRPAPTAPHACRSAQSPPSLRAASRSLNRPHRPAPVAAGRGPVPALSSLVRPDHARYPDHALFRSRMSTSRFVHLHVHTEFSLADSTIRVPEKPDQADPKGQTGQPAEPRGRTRHARAGSHRPQQPVRAGQVLQGRRRRGHQADRRRRRDDRHPGHDALAHDPAVPRPRRLPEPVAPADPRLDGRPPPRGRRGDPPGVAAERPRQPVRPGRARQPGRAPVRRRPRRPGRAAAGRLAARVRRRPASGTDPHRARGRGTLQPVRAACGRRAWPAGGGQQRCALPVRQRLQCARGAGMHFLRTRARRSQTPARVQRPAVPEVRRRDGRAVRRCARRDRQHAGAGAALQHRDAPGHLLPARLPGAGRRDAGQLDPQPVARWPGRAPGKNPIAPGKTRQDYVDRLEFELDTIIKMGFPATS